MNTEKTLEINSTILEKVKFGMVTRFSEELLHNTEISISSLIADEFNVRFAASILGQKRVIKEKVCYEFPANWFQWLVNDHFPKWYKKRFPVKTEYFYKDVEITASALFPELKPIAENYNIVYHAKAHEIIQDEDEED